MDVTAAILAGGLGTRLRSVVGDRPKVLAPVGGRPFLTRLLDQLAAASFREVVLLTGYRAEQVRDALGVTFAGMRLIYADEPFPLGTAGALRRALPLLSRQRVLLLNGDSYCDVDLDDFYEWHCRQSGGTSLVMVHVPDGSRFGQLRQDKAARIVRFEEKGKASGPGWINAGVYLIERDLLAELPTKYPLSLERDVLADWVGRQLVFGMKCSRRFLDIGTPESYAEADIFFQPGPRRVATERSPARC
jgi:NDP-sugar pyrophosphorylase family protein